jgi:hypothetical protein
MYHIYYLCMAWYGEINPYALAATMRIHALSLTMD